MINKKLLTAAGGLALALGAAACNTDKLTNLNENPNNPVDVPIGSLFTNATASAVAGYFAAFEDLRGGEVLTQHVAEVQYPDGDRYTRLTGGSTTTWYDNPYVRELEDFQKIVERGTAATQPRDSAPALVMRTWRFGYLTDTWG